MSGSATITLLESFTRAKREQDKVEINVQRGATRITIPCNAGLRERYQGTLEEEEETLIRGYPQRGTRLSGTCTRVTIRERRKSS
jgi:hypothetical protein